MKTLTKTFGLSLIFSAIILLSTIGNAQADCHNGDCAKKSLKADSAKAEKAETVSAEIDEFDFDFEDPFFFSDKIVINVYNQHDELIYNKAFSKEEAEKDTELKEMLKQSEFLLSIDNQYYYYSKGAVIAMQ